MQFNIPARNEIAAPLTNQRPLRAEGNIRYLDFIRLIQKMWLEIHPDIPIKPVQSKTFVKYPMMTYSLQNRRPFTNEPKPRLREQIVNKDGELYVINGQRFENTIVFTVYTQEDPELAEAIIELFEEFMSTYTGVFKRLGVSEFVYVRRLPDSEQTRQDQDMETRAVAYMMTEERNTQMKVERLEEIIVDARIFLKASLLTFSVGDGQDYLTVPGHHFLVDEVVVIYAPTDFSVSLPQGLHHGWSYRVTSITDDTITLENFNGTDPHIIGPGQGRIVSGNYYRTGLNIEDLYMSATPRTS